MSSIKDAAAEFLADKRIAVTGVSRTPKTHGSNNVYRRLRERGYQVFAVNPNTDKAGQPVLVGTAYGIWKENQLDKQVWQVIDERAGAPAGTPGTTC